MERKLRRSPTYLWGRSRRAWHGPASGYNTPWPIVCTRRFKVSCQEVQDLLHGYVDGELDLWVVGQFEVNIQCMVAPRRQSRAINMKLTHYRLL
jgi:hypothetical protein